MAKKVTKKVTKKETKKEKIDKSKKLIQALKNHGKNTRKIKKKNLD